jgi:hypothetical protein
MVRFLHEVVRCTQIYVREDTTFNYLENHNVEQTSDPGGAGNHNF